MLRDSWEVYFMKMAVAAAGRSTCPKASVGAVVVLDGNVVGTGYNGSPIGMDHCSEIGCAENNGHCFNVVHAEANSLLRSGERANGAVLYCTHRPCLDCCKLIINAGISKVMYRIPYFDSRCSIVDVMVQDQYLEMANIEVKLVEAFNVDI